jgi:hypothetical protein
MFAEGLSHSTHIWFRFSLHPNLPAMDGESIEEKKLKGVRRFPCQVDAGLAQGVCLVSRLPIKKYGIPFSLLAYVASICSLKGQAFQLTSGFDFLSIQAYRLWMEHPSRGKVSCSGCPAATAPSAIAGNGDSSGGISSSDVETFIPALRATLAASMPIG